MNRSWNMQRILVNATYYLKIQLWVTIHLFFCQICKHFYSPNAVHDRLNSFTCSTTLIMFGEEYKLWRSSSCNLVYSSATTSFLGRNSRRGLGTYLNSRSDIRGNTTQNNQEEKCRHCDGFNYWHINASRLVKFVSSHQGWIDCVLQETWC